MTKINITQLIWDDAKTEHIKKHNVTIGEVEEAVQNINAHREGYEKRMFLIGRAGKRIGCISKAERRHML